MLAEQEITLRDMFRAQARIDRQEWDFYQETQRTLDERKIEMRRQERTVEELKELQHATGEQIAAFREHLDRYDTAVVEALTENEEALEKARQKREGIEASASRLPDGRLVFKTQDGKRVFDQNEREVPSEVVHPASIPNGAPSWEQYKAARSEEKHLEQDRDTLHRYQQKLDDARDTINKGDVSKKDLDAMDAALQASMPDIVKQKVAHPGQSREAGAPQQDVPLQADMAPVAAGSRPVPSYPRLGP